MNADKVDLPMVLDDRNQEAMVSFWWTSTLLRKSARGFFKSCGTSEAQFNLLMTLKRSDGPLTQNDLSRELLVDKSNITGLLDKLEEQALIKRNRVAGDRRSYHITLTESGRKLIDEVDPLYAETVAGIMSRFSPEERDELIRLTRKLRSALLESGL